MKVKNFCCKRVRVLTKRRKTMSDKRNAKGAGSFVKNSGGTITHRKSLGLKQMGKEKY